MHVCRESCLHSCSPILMGSCVSKKMAKGKCGTYILIASWKCLKPSQLVEIHLQRLHCHRLQWLETMVTFHRKKRSPKVKKNPKVVLKYLKQPGCLGAQNCITCKLIAMTWSWKCYEYGTWSGLQGMQNIQYSVSSVTSHSVTLHSRQFKCCMPLHVHVLLVVCRCAVGVKWVH